MADDYIPIIKDLDKFQERVFEVTAETSLTTITNVVSRIKRALYQDKDYVALCAPQIGENLRVFVVKTAGREADKFKVFINPMVVAKEGMHLSRETNVSIPDKEFIIPRFDKVHVAYQTVDGHISSETYAWAYGEVVQQMIEMLDGITLEDYGLEIDETFDKASKKKQEEIIATYLEAIKGEADSYEKEIEETPELKEMNDTINFMAGMLEGKITPINPVDKDGNPLEIKKENKA